MADKHIDFSELGFDDPVNQSHLESCPDCRRQWDIFRFLEFQVKSVPHLEAPPFFAQRITQRVCNAGTSFAFLLQRAAQQLVPLFVALILATTFLLYSLTRLGADEDQSVILFEEPEDQQDFTVEFVVNSLREPPREEVSFEEPD